MDRNRLKGKLGDQINAILSAAGMNFSKLLKWVAAYLRHFYRIEIWISRWQVSVPATEI